MELILLASLLGIGVAFSQLTELFSPQDEEKNDNPGYQDGPTSGISSGSEEPLHPADPFDSEGTEGDDTLSGWNNLRGYGGNDYINAMNFGGEYQAVGLVEGGAGNDTIVAQSGLDGEGEIYGGIGDDEIIAHAGATISAGDGDDFVVLNSSQLNHGEVLLGEGQDIVVFSPHSFASGVNVEEQPADVDLDDFDQTEDHLGVMIDPTQLNEMRYSRDANDDGTGTILTFFQSDNLNGIEANAALKINLPRVSPDADIAMKIFRQVDPTHFVWYSSFVIPK